MPHTVLENLWRRLLSPARYTARQDSSWNEEIEMLYRLGINMEDTFRYVYSQKPDLINFQQWIELNRKDSGEIEQQLITGEVLSQDDLAFYHTNGYIIVRNAVSKADCEATCNAVWDFLGKNPSDKSSWYNVHEEQRGLMVSFYDHETLNKNRFSPKIKKAYQQLYNTTELYRTIDKVSFSPPETETFSFMGSSLHWDVSLQLPIPFALQGLLYLTDCGPDDGAFNCVPGFHNIIDNWLGDIQPNENPREKALKTLQPLPVTANAGDFIIWNNKLPHCATPNKGLMPRMVQYLTYLPEGYKAASEFL